MMHRIAAALAATALVTTSLAAQSNEKLCKDIADIHVGQWVEYQISNAPTANAPQQMRMAVIGTDTSAGKSMYWIEMKMDSPQMGNVIIQELVPDFPPDPQSVQAVVMKRGNEPAVKLPEQMLQMMRSRMPHNPTLSAAERCRSGKVIGWETVTVPAGTFHALHVQDTTSTAPNGGGDAWIAEGVPFGLVKASGSGGGTIELAAKGTDAKSSITETPQEMPMGGPGH